MAAECLESLHILWCYLIFSRWPIILWYVLFQWGVIVIGCYSFGLGVGFMPKWKYPVRPEKNSTKWGGTFWVTARRPREPEVWFSKRRDDSRRFSRGSGPNCTIDQWTWLDPEQLVVSSSSTCSALGDGRGAERNRRRITPWNSCCVSRNAGHTGGRRSGREVGEVACGSCSSIGGSRQRVSPGRGGRRGYIAITGESGRCGTLKREEGHNRRVAAINLIQQTLC